MDWKKFNLGVGPMSQASLDACLKYSKNYDFPLMIIPSRNQVDYDTGYAFRTDELVEYIKGHHTYDSERIKICRDHCGPNFADKDKEVSYETAVISCKNTIASDIENNFDLIHIDVSRIENAKQLQLAEELIEYALSLNPNICFEFGSEDNTGRNLNDTLALVDAQIEFASKYKDHVKFLVNQTGSLTKHTQVGIFDSELSSRIADKIHKAGFLFKEHNGDYLNKDQVKVHRIAGVDSINVAPQIGYIHSYVLNKLGYYYPTQLKHFKKYVLESGAWKKWVVDSVSDTDVKFMASAHYYYKSEYSSIIHDIISNNRLPMEEMLYDEICIALDQYRLGYGE